MNKDIYRSVCQRLPRPSMTNKLCNDIDYSLPKSTNKKDILDWLIYTQFVDNYTIKLCSNADTDIVDDVIQEIYCILCEKSQKDWDKITYQGFGAIKAYVSGVIYRTVKSCSSPVYCKYKKRQKREIHLNPKVWNVYQTTGSLPQIKEFEDEEGTENDSYSFDETDI